MTERRTESRQRTYLKGVMSYQNGTISEDCIVRNLTAHGATLEQAFPRAPQAFELIIADRGARRTASVVWRNGLRVGVRFKPSAPVRRPPAVATFEGE